MGYIKYEKGMLFEAGETVKILEPVYDDEGGLTEGSRVIIISDDDENCIIQDKKSMRTFIIRKTKLAPVGRKGLKEMGLFPILEVIRPIFFILTFFFTILSLIYIKHHGGMLGYVAALFSIVYLMTLILKIREEKKQRLLDEMKRAQLLHERDA